MAVHETSISPDPTQERIAGAILFLDHILSIAVDRVLLIVDNHLEKANPSSQEGGFR